MATYRSALNTTKGHTPGKRATGGSFSSSSIKYEVNGFTIEGGGQVLDGIDWENTVFINARIIYRGGPVDLKNVLFVNCTFDVPSSPRGDSLLNMAILNKESAFIG
jgi:hypothetical protein